MSGFLIRLAQRSIGQTPMVRMRPTIPLLLPAAPSHLAPAEAPPVQAHETAPALREAPLLAGRAAPVAGDPLLAAPPQPHLTAAATRQPDVSDVLTTRIVSEVVERLVPSPVPVPDAGGERRSAPVVEIEREAPPPPPVIRPINTIVVPAAPPLALPDVAATLAAQPVVVQGGDAPSLDRDPMPRPAPIEPALPKHAPQERADPIGVAIAPRPPSQPLPPMPNPKSQPLAASFAKPPQPEERVVHVRIGAIEIHAPAPPPGAMPPAPAPVQQAASFRGGFDDFARLRSYAPWEW